MPVVFISTFKPCMCVCVHVTRVCSHMHEHIKLYNVLDSDYL